jgi:hypothetical protein
MNNQGKAPEYAYNTSLGLYFGYQNMIYTYSKILDTYNTPKTLPTTVAAKPWTRYNMDLIVEASFRVKNYVETNHCLPNSVNIYGTQVTMPSFLKLLVITTLNIKNNLKTPVDLVNCNPAPSPRDQIRSGDMPLSEYSKIAQDVYNFMTDTGTAPEYAYNTSLGSYLGYYTMVYMYSNILASYDQNNVLADKISVKPWIYVLLPILGNVPSDLVPYTWSTSNCQSGDPAIMALAYSLASSSNSAWEIGSKILNWVRDNINYAFYYNTKYGAIGTYNGRQANCCDHAHLVIALARAIGIPARYVHADAYFLSSGTWYGHVWAELYINGKWVSADATSYRNSLGVINNWDTGSVKIKGYYRELPF